MPISIEINNVQDLVEKLRAKQLERLLRDAFKASGKYVRGIAKIYPPKPPQSTYRRTFQLANKWDYEFSALEARIYNNTPYAPYVMGPDEPGAGKEKQTLFHAETGWKTTEQISTETEEAVRKQFEEVINAGYNF